MKSLKSMCESFENVNEGVFNDVTCEEFVKKYQPQIEKINEEYIADIDAYAELLKNCTQGRSANRLTPNTNEWKRVGEALLSYSNGLTFLSDNFEDFDYEYNENHDEIEGEKYVSNMVGLIGLISKSKIVFQKALALCKK